MSKCKPAAKSNVFFFNAIDPFLSKKSKVR